MIENMTAKSIAPLRKANTRGALYTRFPNIEAKLAQTIVLTQTEISVRCAVEDCNDPKYLPSECLMYLVRDNRSNQPGIYFETIYKTLLTRVMRQLPSEENTDLTDSTIRAETLGCFAELLAADRVNYCDGLDYYEIRFEASVASLRKNVERKAFRERNRSKVLDTDPETGELSKEIEKAAGSMQPTIFAEFDQANDRLRLDNAISTLPELQIAIIEMLKQNIPIESNDPEVLTISKALGKAEKTIRLHRDKAFQTLKDILKKGEA